MTDADDAAASAAAAPSAASGRPDAATASAASTAAPDAAAGSSAGNDPAFDAIQAALKDVEDEGGEDLEDPDSLTEEQRKHFVEEFGE